MHSILPFIPGYCWLLDNWANIVNMVAKGNRLKSKTNLNFFKNIFFKYMQLHSDKHFALVCEVVFEINILSIDFGQFLE